MNGRPHGKGGGCMVTPLLRESRSRPSRHSYRPRDLSSAAKEAACVKDLLQTTTRISTTLVRSPLQKSKILLHLHVATFMSPEVTISAQCGKCSSCSSSSTVKRYQHTRKEEVCNMTILQVKKKSSVQVEYGPAAGGWSKWRSASEGLVNSLDSICQ